MKKEEKKAGISVQARIQMNVMLAVARERARQDGLWGQQDHPLEWWIAILGEEYGETCRAVLESHFGEVLAAKLGRLTPRPDLDLAAIKSELTHVAAVAVAALECIERKELGNAK